MNPQPKPAVPVQTRWGNRIPIPLLTEPILSEDIDVCCIGHAFGPVPPDPGQPPAYFVNDFLVDQSQSTGCGSFMTDPIQFDLTKSKGYMYRVFGACGKKFHVNIPSGVSNAYFSAWLGRQETTPPSGGTFSQMPAQVTFPGLVGPAPKLTYSSFFISAADNSALIFEIEGNVTASFQFDSLQLQENFSRSIDPGAKWYDPLSYAVPLGTKSIYPKSETFVVFGYQTSNPVDPGPLVKLV